jgi:hypothetical protein
LLVWHCEDVVNELFCINTCVVNFFSDPAAARLFTVRVRSRDMAVNLELLAFLWEEQILLCASDVNRNGPAQRHVEVNGGRNVNQAIDILSDHLSVVLV